MLRSIFASEWTDAAVRFHPIDALLFLHAYKKLATGTGNIKTPHFKLEKSKPHTSSARIIYIDVLHSLIPGTCLPIGISLRESGIKGRSALHLAGFHAGGE
jgi:hypothetical protein